MTETILGAKNMDRIIRLLGSGHYFDDLKALQLAVDKSGAIPKDFFEQHGGCYETWGYEWRPKEQLRVIREELVAAIIAVINAENRKPYEEKMEADHYARYFHALALLKVDKSVLHMTKHDYIRNAFLKLWELDDGSDENWKIIDGVAWYISEAVKGIKGLPVRSTIHPDE